MHSAAERATDAYFEHTPQMATWRTYHTIKNMYTTCKSMTWWPGGCNAEGSAAAGAAVFTSSPMDMHCNGFVDSRALVLYRCSWQPNALKQLNGLAARPFCVDGYGLCVTAGCSNNGKTDLIEVEGCQFAD